ncbi:PEP-CTERM sorting domain-containing protein [Altererythrobacter luteolus]|uniref:PEP-CTERM sorting domain-containing protein n=1 Tax=Pontixanthobacter luteolus TaxID=295089 RepID=A0A6I4UWG6_9SPHN|nr:PEP-CTERM sorting domain-containing protein [Pontixanthobacter luteolus]MXP45905.1 PEP-CTERM sorting domain-containing protein [Pontixanthobacter luteolus]
MRTCIFLLAGAVIASPAHAGGGTPIPEPSNMALFGLGLTGLIVGRMIARRKQNQQDD